MMVDTSTDKLPDKLFVSVSNFSENSSKISTTNEPSGDQTFTETCVSLNLIIFL